MAKHRQIKKKINVFTCMCCHLVVCVTHRKKKKKTLIVVVECALVYCLFFFVLLGKIAVKKSAREDHRSWLYEQRRSEKKQHVSILRERERESKVHQNLWGEGRICYDIWYLYLPLSSPPKSTKIHDLRKSFKI